MQNDAEQEKLIDEFAERWGTTSIGKCPDVLYHYTSIETLLKIVKGKSVWMTHALFLNDSSEFVLGMQKFKQGLDCLKKDGIDGAMSLV